MSATTLARWMWSSLIGAGLCIATVGCGNTATSTPDQTAATSAGDTSGDGSTSDALPTVAIGNSAVTPAGSIAGDDDDAIEIADLKVGSAEWLLREITRLRVQGYPDEKDTERLKDIRRERNLKLIQLATEVIAQTHENPDQERLFRLGAHHLMEARLELALSGDTEHVEQLYADAASLHERNTQSKAAEEAAYVLVKFAQANAARFAKQDPRWLAEFARQARLYVSNFPEDQLRGPNALFAAAESCELHGNLDEAKVCYAQLQQQFPEHLLAAQATGILRRLAVVGQPITLGGPTLEGDYWSLADAEGKVVLIAFWSSHAQSSPRDAAALAELHQKFAGSGLQIVGVNLDLEESDVRDFVAAQHIEWPQIFFVEENQRGWDHPVANYYGIRQVPAYWLVDKEGIVRDTKVELKRFTEELPSMLAAHGESGAPAPDTSE